jgi:hypothetical protein
MMILAYILLAVAALVLAAFVAFIITTRLSHERKWKDIIAEDERKRAARSAELGDRKD